MWPWSTVGREAITGTILDPPNSPVLCYFDPPESPTPPSTPSSHDRRRSERGLLQEIIKAAGAFFRLPRPKSGHQANRDSGTTAAGRPEAREWKRARHGAYRIYSKAAFLQSSLFLRLGRKVWAGKIVASRSRVAPALAPVGKKKVQSVVQKNRKPFKRRHVLLRRRRISKLDRDRFARERERHPERVTESCLAMIGRSVGRAGRRSRRIANDGKAERKRKQIRTTRVRECGKRGTKKKEQMKRSRRGVRSPEKGLSRCRADAEFVGNSSANGLKSTSSFGLHISVCSCSQDISQMEVLEYRTNLKVW